MLDQPSGGVAQKETEALGPLLLRVGPVPPRVIESYLGTDESAINRSGVA